VLLLLVVAANASAQDWGDESDDWGAPSSPAPRASSAEAPAPDGPGWSFKTGLGFTHDPTSVLLNFELPYRFDRWVSVAPKIQVGLEEDITIVAPTVNVGVRIPDMPGRGLDRLHPYGFVGMGFAVIEDDGEPNDKRSAGFLVDVGAGLEYQLSPSVFLDSQMTFNFLPKRTQDERFFFAWQIVGLRFAF